MAEPALAVPVTVSPPRHDEDPDTAPKFEKHGLGYSYTMPRVATSFHVGHLKRSNGALHGEVVVRTQWPGAKTIADGVVLAPTILNMHAAVSRKSLAKLVSERVKGPPEENLDWVGFVEEFCALTMIAEQDENMYEEVGNKEAGQEENVLAIDPLLPKGKATILFADGGSGKSLTAAALAVSILSGLAIIPGMQPNIHGPVLYLDWETDSRDMDRRVKQICAGAKIPPQFFHYRFCTRRLHEIADNVARFADKEGVEFLVIDSAGMASGANGDNADPADAALRLFGAIRAIERTTLVVDHVPKFGNGAQQSSKPYGSTYKVNLARATWELRQAVSPGDRALHMALYHRKANTTELHSALGYRVKFDQGQVWWESEDITQPDLTAGLPLADRLEIVLRETGDMTTREMAQLTDSTESTIRSVLSRNGGRFASVARGRWRVLEGGYRDPTPPEMEDDEVPPPEVP